MVEGRPDRSTQLVNKNSVDGLEIPGDSREYLGKGRRNNTELTTKPTEFGSVISFVFVLTLLEVHCKFLSHIKFRTFGAIISSDIFSSLFILSSPSEMSVGYLLDLPMVLHVLQDLFFFSRHVFPLCSSD